VLYKYPYKIIKELGWIRVDLADTCTSLDDDHLWSKHSSKKYKKVFFDASL
jgi:hypothetical protein